MRTTVVIANLKCDLCEHSVKDILNSAIGISDVSIDASTGRVAFNYKTHNAMEGLRMELAEKGFPIIKDPSEILVATSAKAG